MNYIEILKQWIPFQTYSIIYHNEQDELSSRAINSKIKGKRNITLIVETMEGYIFGTYHQNPIRTTVNGFYARHLQEGGYFLFTLNNPLHTQPMQFFPSNLNDYLCIYNDDNENSLIGMCNAFELKKHRSFISSDFSFYYRTEYLSSIFVGKVSPETFDLQRLIIIEWK